jgi:hypothetical protein
MIKALFLSAICVSLTGYSIIVQNRVFPKVTWYWSKEAKQQRVDEAEHQKINERYFQNKMP